MFSTNNYGNNWRVVNVSQSQKLQFLSGDEIVNMNHPKIGTVLSNKDGIAICMEDCIYLDGDMDVKTC